MSKGINISVDDSDFKRDLIQLAHITGKTVRDVLKKQTKTLSRRLMDLTPPTEGLAQGRAKVASDISKVFADLGGTKWEDKSLSKMWRAGNYSGVQKALSLHPDYLSFPIARYERIFAQPIPNIHWAAINRSGRVPKGFVTRYAVGKKGALKKYIRKRQARVGIAKSGWLAATIELGANAPQYVKRHGAKRGSIVNKCYGVSPLFIITNAVKTFPRGMKAEDIVRRAIQNQEQALKNNIEIELKKRGLK